MSKKEIDERVEAVREDYERRAEERKGLERTWLVCMNYYAGNQYAEVLPTGAIGDMTKKYPWQMTSVYNHVAPIIESRLAKFNRMKKDVTCLPSSVDPEDVKRANVATALIRSAEENVGFKKLSEECAFWAEVCGTAFYKVVWSKDRGALLTEDGVREGDVSVTVIPPYEIYPDDLTAGDVADCRSLIHAKAYPVEAVEKAWGVKVQGSASVMGYGKSGVRSLEKDGYVLVLERYERPTRERPNGRLLIVAGDELLYDGDLPFTAENGVARGFPFVRQAALPTPSSFFGAGLVERMIPIQRDYNEIKNRKHEYINRMTAGVLLAEDGSVDLDELDEEGIAPGKVIVYRQGSNPPQAVSFGGIPSDFADEEDRLLKEFVTVSGVSDFLLTGAMTDKTNYSGAALSVIIEQATNRLCVTTESIKNAVREVARKILALYGRYATKEQIARLANASVREAGDFLGGALGAEDIVFDLDEVQADTVTERRGLAKEIFEMGLLQNGDGKVDEAGKRSLLKLLGCEGLATGRGIDALHRKKADRENREAASGLVAEETDDHAIHIEEHLGYLLENARDAGEKKHLTEHIRDHRRMLGDA